MQSNDLSPDRPLSRKLEVLFGISRATIHRNKKDFSDRSAVHQLQLTGRFQYIGLWSIESSWGVSVSQRLKIPLPDRCLLYQALLWVSDSVSPVQDTHFLSLPDPAVFGPTNASKRELLLALMSGHLKADGIFWGDEGHQNHEFEDQTVDLSPGFWEVGDVNWQESSLQSPDRSGATGAFNLITVRTSELMEVFPGPSEPAQGITDMARTSPPKASTPTPATAKRGRPPIYNWSAFFVEIIVRADLDGLPESQAELERSMADWCQDQWGASPGDSTIREKISPIYNHLRKVRK